MSNWGLMIELIFRSSLNVCSFNLIVSLCTVPLGDVLFNLKLWFQNVALKAFTIVYCPVRHLMFKYSTALDCPSQINYKPLVIVLDAMWTAVKGFVPSALGNKHYKELYKKLLGILQKQRNRLYSQCSHSSRILYLSHYYGCVDTHFGYLWKWQPHSITKYVLCVIWRFRFSHCPPLELLQMVLSSACSLLRYKSWRWLIWQKKLCQMW